MTKHTAPLRTLLIAVLLLLFLPLVEAEAQQADFRVVPLPNEVKATRAGSFALTDKTLICYPQGEKGLKRSAEMLASYIEELTGMKLSVSNLAAQRNCIRLANTLHASSPEAYRIRVNSEIVLLEGASDAGAFYAVQTLRKALPVGVAREVTLPAVEVTDAPRFAYRGAHLDVARHFFSVDSLRRFVDILALHNINRFHLHLTDDQGWRIEIKKYPRLTEVGAMRGETVIGHNTGRFDGTPHGGFYTQKQLKELVRYAEERNVTIVPEIDLPGHMQAALAAYPELGCTGGPYKVWGEWGVSPEVLCAGNNRVLQFIDDVLGEVARVFPSKYIHVGGDECPKTRWRDCPKCQARIQSEHLEADGRHTAEERLQSYIIRHAERCLAQLGRSLIGWDETLEGGLAPGATVMSWRGEGGGIEAARQRHEVVMSPNTYLYFDYYQSRDKASEPEAIGGYLPIEHVYGYEPVPQSLSDEERKYIIGVQANCWTEYIKTFRQVEYMELPRMAALSEVQWCKPGQRDFNAFMQRLPRLIDVYRREGYNFARVIYNVDLQLRADTVRRAVCATLSTIDNAPVHYTLDGTAPTLQSPLYAEPLRVDSTCRLRCAAFRSWGSTPEVTETFHFSKSTACPVRLLQQPHPKQTYGGAPLLTDGLKATDTNYASGRWIGFCGADLEAVIDLGSAKNVSSLALNCCVEKGYWIFDTREISVLGSADGKDFRELARESYPEQKETDANAISPHRLTFAPTAVRYVKVKVASEHSIPSWHPGKGNPAFVFVDELSID